METAQVKRPWGGYSIMRKSGGFWVKKLYVNAGARLSLQSHDHRNEVWLVLSGTIAAQIGKTTKEAHVGELVYVPKGVKHRITGLTDAVVLEFAYGKVLEKDIHRYEDDFGRVNESC